LWAVLHLGKCTHRHSWAPYRVYPQFFYTPQRKTALSNPGGPGGEVSESAWLNRGIAGQSIWVAHVCAHWARKTCSWRGKPQFKKLAVRILLTSGNYCPGVGLQIGTSSNTFPRVYISVAIDSWYNASNICSISLISECPAEIRFSRSHASHHSNASIPLSPRQHRRWEIVIFTSMKTCTCSWHYRNAKNFMCHSGEMSPCTD